MTAVLIVDDLEQNRYLLRAMLVASGDEVLEAANGAEALELARRTRPDLIISDVLMPQMDGFALCRECKRDEQLRDIPFVFCTATYTDPRDEALALQLGAARFIVKPVESEDFIAIVREVLRAHAAGELASSTPPLEEETAFLRLYNTALIRKLEDKTLDLDRLNRSLAESEERFRRLAENAQDAIYRYRLAVSPGFEYASPAALTITGYAPEEYYADPQLHQRLLPPEERLVLDGILKEGVASSELISMKLIRKDGSIIWVEPRITVIRNEEGTAVALQAIVRDISERKRAEETLRESEEKYRVLFEGSTHGILATDVETKRFVDANPSMCRMLGYSAAELLQLGLADLHPKDALDRVISEMETQITEGKSLSLAIPCLRKDGTVFYADIGGATTISHGRRWLVGFFADVTERKRAEEDLKQHLAELVAMQSVSAAMRTAQTVDELLPRLLDETLAALNTEAGVIWLCNQARDELRVAVTRAWFGQLEEPPMKPGEGIAGTVFASGQAHLSAEFARDPLGQVAGHKAFPAGWGGACVPIRTAPETFGVLFVAVPLPRQVSSGQMKLLVSLAEMAGAAVARMRVHEETVKHLEQLQALHTVDLGIAASLDLRVTLSILLEQVISQLRVDAADVLLVRQPMNVLEYTVGRGFHTREIEHTRLRVGESFAGRAVQERSTVQVAGPAMVHDDRRFSALWASEGFSAYVGVPLIAKGQVKGVLEVFQRAQPAESDAERAPGSAWFDFLEMLSSQAAVALDNTQLYDELQRSNTDLSLAYDATIEGWSRAMDLRDKETEGHTLRVTEMTERMAKQMGISETEIVHIRRGALLHDIGKMGVPDGILLKPGKLTDEEWETMRQHPQFAYDMLSSIAYLHPALDIPHCHHEKWDGSGYPQGLKGEQIPLAARMFAVVDVWDALTSDRPYRPAWAKQEALGYIREESGKHFDPRVVEQFLRQVTGV